MKLGSKSKKGQAVEVLVNIRTGFKMSLWNCIKLRISGLYNSKELKALLNDMRKNLNGKSK